MFLICRERAKKRREREGKRARVEVCGFLHRLESFMHSSMCDFYAEYCNASLYRNLNTKYSVNELENVFSDFITHTHTHSETTRERERERIEIKI